MFLLTIYHLWSNYAGIYNILNKKMVEKYYAGCNSGGVMVAKLWQWIKEILHFIIYKLFKITLSTEQWENLLQFVKFGLVGVLNNLICYGTYLILAALGVHYTPANVIGFSVSVFNSYYWNNKYVFATENKCIWWKTFLKTYISYAGTGIVLSNILLIVWIEILNIPKLVAPIINLFITIPINYLLNKLWAYREHSDSI